MELLSQYHIPIGLPLLAIVFEQRQAIAQKLIAAIGLVIEFQGFGFKLYPGLVKVFGGQIAEGDGHVGDEGAIGGLATVVTCEAQGFSALTGEGGLQGAQGCVLEDFDVDDVLRKAAKTREGDRKSRCGFGEAGEGLLNGFGVFFPVEGWNQGDVGRGTEGLTAVVAIAEILPNLVGVVQHFLGWEEGDEVAITKCCASSIGGHGIFL